MFPELLAPNWWIKNTENVQSDKTIISMIYMTLRGGWRETESYPQIGNFDADLASWMSWTKSFGVLTSHFLHYCACFLRVKWISVH